MAINITYYNQLFLDRIEKGKPVFNDAAEKYGVRIEPVEGVKEGETYWCVIGVHHLTGAENGGNHNIFCEVLDEPGGRLNRARLQLQQGNLKPVYAVVDKPPHEAGTNFPIWGATPSEVRVYTPTEAPLPSQGVSGLRINHADEEAGNTIGHHSFYLAFQRTVMGDGGETGPGPGPKPKPPQPAMGSIQVVVNRAWLNTLPVDEEGKVTFEVVIV